MVGKTSEFLHVPVPWRVGPVGRLMGVQGWRPGHGHGSEEKGTDEGTDAMISASAQSGFWGRGEPEIRSVCEREHTAIGTHLMLVLLGE